VVGLDRDPLALGLFGMSVRSAVAARPPLAGQLLECIHELAAAEPPRQIDDVAALELASAAAPFIEIHADPEEITEVVASAKLTLAAKLFALFSERVAVPSHNVFDAHIASARDPVLPLQ